MGKGECREGLNSEEKTFSSPRKLAAQSPSLRSYSCLLFDVLLLSVQGAVLEGVFEPMNTPLLTV